MKALSLTIQKLCPMLKFFPWTNRQTDRQTDGQAKNYMSPNLWFLGGKKDMQEFNHFAIRSMKVWKKVGMTEWHNRKSKHFNMELCEKNLLHLQILFLGLSIWLSLHQNDRIVSSCNGKLLLLSWMGWERLQPTWRRSRWQWKCTCSLSLSPPKDQLNPPLSSQMVAKPERNM